MPAVVAAQNVLMRKLGISGEEARRLHEVFAHV
jgi:hypothetical protein